MKLGGTCAAMCAAVTVATTGTADDTLPTDADLRSAYCIPVLQHGIDVLNQAAAAHEAQAKSAQTPEQRRAGQELRDIVLNRVSETQSTLHRLTSYLLPRMQYRDQLALTAAGERGEADVKVLQAKAVRCPTRCGGFDVSDAAWYACAARCVDKELIARVRACAAPTWLPF